MTRLSSRRLRQLVALITVPAVPIAMRRILPLVVVLSLGSGLLLVAQQMPHSSGPQKAAPDNPTAVYPDGFAARWIEDADFVYGPALLDFDLRAYLAASAPHLVPHAEFISHWCGYYSISPKVLLAILDMRTGVLSPTSTAAAIANPTAGLVPGIGFEEQVKTVLSSLYVDFYAFRAAPNARDLAINGATFALLNLFRGPATFDSFSTTVADATARQFRETYARFFPTPAVSADEIEVLDVPPSNFLQLPWRNGQAWRFGGVHTNTGTDPGIMNALDFFRGGQGWGADTSTDYVAAAHAGTVSVFSSCNVRVTASNGWATGYYHLSNLVVTNGQRVNANDVIGVYANSVSQALCQGGHSSGPHVHFSLYQNGAHAPLSGVSLSGNVVHPGRYSYDYDRNYMWMQSETTGTRYYWDTPVVSAPTTTGAPGTPTGVSASVSGLLVNVSWIRPSTGAAPTSYRLDFRSGGTFVTSVPVGPLTSTSLTAPPGTVGTFTVTVAALAGSTAGPASAAASFTIGPPSGCGVPATPTGLTGTFANGTVVVRWNPVAGAASHILRAGTSSGSSDLYNANVGGLTTVSASGLPAGFRAYVRVIAVNGCGQQSAPTADFVVGGGVPTPGGGTDMEVTLTWDSGADFDLHIIEPDGTHVYFFNPAGRTVQMGQDSTAYGPETATIARGAAMAGTYSIYVVHYGQSVATNATVQIRVNRGSANERAMTVVRSSVTPNSALGVNVADVNVLGSSIIERTGARATDGPAALAAAK